MGGGGQADHRPARSRSREPTTTQTKRSEELANTRSQHTTRRETEEVTASNTKTNRKSHCTDAAAIHNATTTRIHERHPLCDIVEPLRQSITKRSNENTHRSHAPEGKNKAHHLPHL